MSQGWYVESGGKVDGPISARELRERAAAGKLRPSDKVSPDGKKWAPAAKVKGLTFSQPTPAPVATVTPPASPAIDPLATVSSPQPATKPSASSLPAAPPPRQAAVETVESSVEQITGYEILGVLGKGACGVVFRARQIKLDRIVALKTVLTDRRPTAAALARFDKEAVSLAKLRHPNIVGVFDCGHQDGQAFFAMELLDGEDLGNRLDNKGPLDEFAAWHIARQTAAALAHAAELGVYHRDIKPANLFLTPPPTGYPLPPGIPLVKVTDFGLALTRQAGAESTDQRLTAAGVVLGTPAYMPPEQFAGSDIDHRADIYALGATVYHVLSGKSPFDGASIWEVMIKKSEPTPRLCESVSPESAELVAAMMATKADDRIGSYRELLDRIDALPFMGPVVSSPSVRLAAAGVVPTLPATQIPSEPDSEPDIAPAPRNKKKLYLFAVLGGLLIAAAAVVGSKMLGDKTETQGLTPGSTKNVEFVTGDREDLFNHESLLGWSPVGGGPWSIEQDDEKTAVLTGKNGVRRPFKPTKHFRVSIGLDFFQATTAEVVVAVSDGPADKAKQWSIRLERARNQAIFGVRDGDRGELQPIGIPVPVPTPKQIEEIGKRPYLEVRYERAGGKIRAFYDSKLLGEIDDDGRVKMSEVKLLVDGGAVRIDTVAVEELKEKP